MSSPVNDIERDLWRLVLNTDQYRVLDFPLGSRTVMSRTEMQPFAETRGHRQPFAEVLCVESGWGSLLTGHEDEPKETALNEGTAVVIEPNEWHKVTTWNAPLIFLSIFEGDRRGKRY